MPIVVEDGTGVAGADSYVSLATFRKWALDRGYEISTMTDTDTESLLRNGCDFIERKLFKGSAEFPNQGLSFPRSILDAKLYTVSTGIPAKLKIAQMLLAMESMNGPLTAAARGNKYTATKIDQIYLKYADAAKGSGDLFFPAIDDLLSEWLSFGGAVIRTVRA